jgi:hypothetical protein
MPAKGRDELEMLVEEVLARNAVLETIQTQLMVKLAAALFDKPQEFVRLVMMDAEENLRRAAKQVSGEEKTRADAAIAIFENYSMRLIAGMTPKSRAQ